MTRVVVHAFLAVVLVLGGFFIYDLSDSGLTDPGEPGYPCGVVVD